MISLTIEGYGNVCFLLYTSAWKREVSSVLVSGGAFCWVLLGAQPREHAWSVVVSELSLPSVSGLVVWVEYVSAGTCTILAGPAPSKKLGLKR